MGRLLCIVCVCNGSAALHCVRVWMIWSSPIGFLADIKTTSMHKVHHWIQIHHCKSCNFGWLDILSVQHGSLRNRCTTKFPNMWNQLRLPPSTKPDATGSIRGQCIPNSILCVSPNCVLPRKICLQHKMNTNLTWLQACLSPLAQLCGSFCKLIASIAFISFHEC